MKTTVLLLIAVMLVLTSPIACWSQNAPSVSGTSNGEPRPPKPARPTTAVEIYHYVMSVYPVRKSDQPYYEVPIGGGTVLQVPYSTAEEDASRRLHGYYNHPLPAMSREDLYSLIKLLSPPSQDEPRAVVFTNTYQENDSPIFSVKVKVDDVTDTAMMFVTTMVPDDVHPLPTSSCSQRVGTKDDCSLVPSVWDSGNANDRLAAVPWFFKSSSADTQDDFVALPLLLKLPIGASKK